MRHGSASATYEGSVSRELTKWGKRGIQEQRKRKGEEECPRRSCQVPETTKTRWKYETTYHGEEKPIATQQKQWSSSLKSSPYNRPMFNITVPCLGWERRSVAVVIEMGRCLYSTRYTDAAWRSVRGPFGAEAATRLD